MKLQPHITILVCAVLFTVLSSTSCKDKNKKTYCEENPTECRSVSVAKDFFYFKQGSWWVYEEETSHERDSMYVYESINDGNSYYFSVRIHSQLQDYNYHYWPVYMSTVDQCSPNTPIETKCLFVNRSKGQSGNFIAESKCFYINYKLNSSVYTGSDPEYCQNNKIIVQEINQNYTVGAFSFGETVKIHELCTYIEGKQPTNHYYSKGIGLVRKELLDSNQVWNLVNYHIQE